MPIIQDGPPSPLFSPIPIGGTLSLADIAEGRAGSPKLQEAAKHAPEGACVCWGIPFEIGAVHAVHDAPVDIDLGGCTAPWLVFLHTTDYVDIAYNRDGFVAPPVMGEGRLSEHVADYVFRYADGSEARVEIRRRHQIGMIQRGWGELCFQAQPHIKPYPIRPIHEQPEPQYRAGGFAYWGTMQTRTGYDDMLPWVNWLWAWENPSPRKRLAGLRIEPKSGLVVISGLASGQVGSNPLRWNARQKAILRVPEDTPFDFDTDALGRLPGIQLDLGQVISAQPRRAYPQKGWAKSYNNQVPSDVPGEVLIEYTAHADAAFHLPKGERVPVQKLTKGSKSGPLSAVSAATQRVRLKVVEKSSKQPVPVKLHVHGKAGEYLAPLDRHRIPNDAWFEDYSCDFVNQGKHVCTYISGDTLIDLPLGTVYIEVSKGFEIAPVRKAVTVGPSTRTITIPIEKVLPWRERGWVTADTHVHFLSPATAQLEGSAEGVNIINLLASQWGELMTNVGDFDGKTTYGSKEAGGDGEYLVRVGTENRQHVMGHISLLGYEGDIITPLCSGGANESALGDPVGVLLIEWARQCRKQNGLVVMPHIPNPRAENAAAILDGSVDAMEMCSWGELYRGIDPYALSDWYRYLNCGRQLPAVGGTDKMSANTAVGIFRTYAYIPLDMPFTYETWKMAVQAGNTFVTLGPLLEFHVEGRPAGARLTLPGAGGTVHVGCHVGSVTVPMTRVDLIVNGAVKESAQVNPWKDTVEWEVKLEASSWVAVLVRGHYADKPEIIAAHSSTVMVHVGDKPIFAPADAMTLLEQMEGALAYLETLGVRADDKAYNRMRVLLTGAYRRLHNELHKRGHYHRHTAATDHAEHHH